jgi:catechol 2,3-dioxygenase-like lactoylglutathione lyase family enzyme
VPGAALRQVCLRLGDTMLELLEYRTPPSDTQRPLLSHSVGASHVAFQVDDIEATKAGLEGKGVRFYSGVNVVDDGVLAGWRWVYFADPDGYPLELVENSYERPGGHAAGIARYLESRPPADSGAGSPPGPEPVR